MCRSTGPTSHGPHSPIEPRPSHTLTCSRSPAHGAFESRSGMRRGASSSRSMAPAVRSRSRHACGMCAAMTRSPACHVPKPGNLTFLSLHYKPYPARPSHCPHSCEHAVFFAVAERQSQVRPVHLLVRPLSAQTHGKGPDRVHTSGTTILARKVAGGHRQQPDVQVTAQTCI